MENRPIMQMCDINFAITHERREMYKSLLTPKTLTNLYKFFGSLKMNFNDVDAVMKKKEEFGKLYDKLSREEDRNVRAKIKHNQMGGLSTDKPADMGMGKRASNNIYNIKYKKYKSLYKNIKKL